MCIRDSSSVAVIVYDVTNPNSFQNIPKWIEFVKEERGNDVLIVLVANKIDAADRRAVTTEEGDGKAKESDLIFMEVSAKDGTNVPELFKTIVNALSNLDMSQVGKNTSRIIIANPAPTAGGTQQNTENKQQGCNC
eukprot:TRINITY_DN1206_c0_g1_i5.p1 TRINITY_DN1206_c0_g1~~TRINITY_DN1206_c0_g1_i5.p1  ORF type:complete len:136 (-),score=36.25 TRINITY_DN1206_c0_g1_i5:42-449(-)